MDTDVNNNLKKKGAGRNVSRLHFREENLGRTKELDDVRNISVRDCAKLRLDGLFVLLNTAIIRLHRLRKSLLDLRSTSLSSQLTKIRNVKIALMGSIFVTL